MADPAGELEAAYQRMRRLFHAIGPGAGRYERFLTEIHGAGWQERALAAGARDAALGYGRRLRDLEERVKRIEEHLKLNSTPE